MSTINRKIMGENNRLNTYKVNFLPDDFTVLARKGENLLKVAVEHGVHIDAACGGAGVCGKCLVKVDGEYEQDLSGKGKVKLDEGDCLACRTQITGDLEVSVPEATRVIGTLPSRSKGIPASRVRQKGLYLDKIIEKIGIRPLMEKVHVTLDDPDPDNSVSDRFRLLNALKEKIDIKDSLIDYELLKRMPEILRQSTEGVTATVAVYDDEKRGDGVPGIVNLEPGDKSGELYAIGVDIGTTSVWAEWLDLRNGKVLAQAADYNDQVRFGADVINRIMSCKKPGGLVKVQAAVVDTINRLIYKMADSINSDPRKISFIMTAGNTTMNHIFLGIDPSYIQMSPHIPAVRFPPTIRAEAVGIKVPQHVYLYSIPSVSGWVGGDIVSGIYVSGFTSKDEITLYVDLGTNGEIVMGNKDFMMSASCSAGPAFEGGGIEHGTRAMDGAVEDFHLNSKDAEPMILTIGQQKAVGICGSGLINIVAGLFLAGVLLPNGKYNTEHDIPRLRSGENGMEYVVVYAENTGINSDITLSEVDLDNLLRAKSAVYAGIRTLVTEVGMEMQDIDNVIIAGSFGQSLDIERAITIGLLPDLPPDKYYFIGNGSLMGTRITAQCPSGISQVDKIAGNITYVDLGATNRFMDEYIAGMFLPHTNGNYFPTIEELMSINRKLLE